MFVQSTMGINSFLRVAIAEGRSRGSWLSWLVIVCCGWWPNAACPAQVFGQTQEAAAEQLEFFEKQVRPLLVEHCYSCHSGQAQKLKAGLYVDSRAGLLRGGDSGPTIVPGDATASLLMQAVRYESFEMPPQGKLSTEQIEVFEQWIEMGAPWPTEAPPSGHAAQAEFDLEARKSQHWVWQPIQPRSPPEVRDRTWPKSAIDQFVLAKLEEHGLQPAPDADGLTLLRRLSFDLIGLPPTLAQVEAFEAELARSSNYHVVLARLVDELLESPHFGERWGRHWLDLVRYSESRGHEFDNDTPNAFQYRDYVIRALNANVPYDQLVREHIAGDLLAEPRLHPQLQFNESILGTGFWFMGEWVHSPVDIRKDETDRFDNMLDVMSKAFLGITVACARCHDHKFDPVPTADYYALSGFLQSSAYRQVRFESLEHNRQIADRLAKLDQHFQGVLLNWLAKQGLQIPEVPRLDLPAQHLIADYSAAEPGQRPPGVTDFLQDGFIFGFGPRNPGQPYLTADAKLQISRTGGAASDPFWRGLKSISEGVVQNKSRIDSLPRSGRTLRTRTFELCDGRVACRVSGSGHVLAVVDSHRLIFGPLHGQTVVRLDGKQPWVQLKLDRYVGHRLHLEFIPDDETELTVELVVQGLTDQQIDQLEQQRTARYQSCSDFAAAAEKIVDTATGSLANVDTDETKLATRPDMQPTDQTGPELVKAWRKAREELRQQVKFESRLAPAMWDGTGEDDRVLIRGNSSNPGRVEPRHFLSAICQSPMTISGGSGRLLLAEQINAEDNPLTARVIVNRLWHHLMGRGIVATVDDFGVLGQPPTHPELLDYLAVQLRQERGSLKSIIRAIVLSRTYQQSSLHSSAAAQQDPTNLWFHYRLPKRLEGEAIRDSLLALSGRLDTTPFGPSIPVHLTPFMDGRGRPAVSGPLDGAGRRSIYVSVRRNFLSPFMLAFDMPVPFSTMGRRNVSNVPAQALILMNDPLVVEQTGAWASRMCTESEDPSERIRRMYLTAFARPPTAKEEELARAFLSSSSDSQSWAEFAHALVNTKEFIYVR